MDTISAEAWDRSEDKQREVRNSLVISYLKIRRVVGYLGMSLPFSMVLGAQLLFHTGLQGSISSYYYTGMRDVFVGTLWAIGFFLLSYRGYDKIDDRLGNLACVFAVGVSLFPTAPSLQSASTLAIRIGYLHLFFAAAFFFTLMWFSLFLFTKTGSLGELTPQKIQRNRVYRTCGIILAACIVLMGAYGLLPDRFAYPLSGYNPTFWLETVAVIAFGFSWFTKGEGILKDDLSEVSSPSLSSGTA